MNLIEQLGGYEKAKDFLNISKGAEWIGVFYMPKLKQALLQYRLEHGIFEVGDLIVSTLEGSEDWKNTVCKILAFHKKMAITTGFSCAIHHYEYRHATPEEIEAGHKL